MSVLYAIKSRPCFRQIIRAKIIVMFEIIQASMHFATRNKYTFYHLTLVWNDSVLQKTFGFSLLLIFTIKYIMHLTS